MQQMQLYEWALNHNIHFFKVDFFWTVTLFVSSHFLRKVFFLGWEGRWGMAVSLGEGGKCEHNIKSD